MNEQIRNDIAKYPDVFWFEKPLGEAELLSSRQVAATAERFVGLWREFGAGLMFESERILRPFAEDVP